MIIKTSKTHFGTFHIPNNVPSDWRKFVCDLENCVFEIMDNLELRPCGGLVGFTNQKGICSLSFHPQKELAAFVTGEGMVVSDFHGNRLWEYKTPVSALLFSREGDEIWVAENISSDKLFISVIDTESGIENSAITMEDTLYESFLRLFHAPKTVLMELAAGQDGCEIWELDDSNSAMQYRVVYPNHCHIMPSFHPDGKRLLTLENNEQLFYCYSWPDVTLVARQRDYTDAEREDDETIPGYSIVYLKNGMAVVQSASGRLYLFDPEKMERLEELVIEGFEPMPIREMFSNSNDESLISPIERFERFGDILIAITGKHAKIQAIILLTEDELIKLT